MRIRPNDTLAGLPVLEVRRFIRHVADGFWQWDPSTMAELLHISKQRSVEAFRVLAELGYIAPSDEPAKSGRPWKVTSHGRALGMARASRPILRTTADRQLAAFLERLRAFNADDNRLALVVRVVVFGSYLLEDMDRLGDVDLALWWTPRVGTWLDYCEAVRVRVREARANGRQFRNIGDELESDETEMLRTLKARKRSLSLHVMGNDATLVAWIARTPHRVVYEALDCLERMGTRYTAWLATASDPVTLDLPPQADRVGIVPEQGPSSRRVR